MGRNRIAHVEWALSALACGLGAWLVDPAPAWALATVLAGGAALALAWWTRRLLLAAALAGLAGGVFALVTSWQVRAVEQRWPEVRESLIQRASRRLDATLSDAVVTARGLADRGAQVSTDAPDEAFQLLSQTVASGRPERGVTIFGPDGRPWAWAGRRRLPPDPGSTELYARITPFYVVLESRRQVGSRVAVGHVLLSADEAVPDRDVSVAALFQRQTGASLEFYAPGTAPFRTDVFDYCLPSCTAAPGVADTIFSVRTVPPAQGPFKLSLLATGGQWVAWLAVTTGLLLGLFGGIGARRLATAVLSGLFLFTPAGIRLGPESLFSPASYFESTLGPFASSAAALAITGGLLLIAGIWLVRSAVVQGTGASGAGLLVALATPFTLRWLAQGISPSAASIAVWLAWQTALALTGAGLTLIAAGLTRSTTIAGRSWAPALGIAWSMTVSVLAVIVWEPVRQWPVWFPVLWAPAVLLAALSADRVRALVASALVCGGIASVFTWNAEVSGRLGRAQQDAGRLEQGPDAVAVGLLERFGADLRADVPPATSAELYARWNASPLGQEGYPAVLVAWAPNGRLRARLDLAELDLPAPLLQALAATAVERRIAVLEEVPRVPGVHAILAQPFDDGSVVTVGLGPRSELVRPFRIARFLRGESRFRPSYDMSLSEPAPRDPVRGDLRWGRDGSVVRGEQRLRLPGGTRHLHIVVPLGEPGPLVIRGALIEMLDVAFAGLCWLLALALLRQGDRARQIRDALRLRSYRSRLALALGVFFVVPTVGFAAWSASRLRAEASRGGDLIVAQVLRDATGAARTFPAASGASVTERLVDLANRFGSDLLLYDRGVLVEASAPVLSELGLVDAYLPPLVYLDLALNDVLEVTANTLVGGRPTRIGFRAVGGVGDRANVVLAAPQLVETGDLVTGQSDLTLALLLVTLLGGAAAVWLAGVAARSLAHPVQALRTAAAAVGRGEQPPPFDSDMPDEFVPVAEGFQRMANDVAAGRAALEAARQRMAAVLRNVATGVVALTNDLRVTFANPRAQELLNVPLGVGAAARASSGAEWNEVWDWAQEFTGSGADVAVKEFTVDSRRIRVHVSGLTAETGGCVVALDDITDLAHAVRVLAWGELARQVAHEIKNPLTPMRLGIQHLQRARRDRRLDFDSTLDQTAGQILAEIERLDAVARAFARFGTPLPEAGPLATVELNPVARETAALYALGDVAAVKLDAPNVVRARARSDELKEVLVNLVENARDAGAHGMTIGLRHSPDGPVVTVTDDGRGISPEDLPLVFEPRFSTNTSGAGLGLAICRRLVESWGGKISLESEVGRGTTVRIQLLD